MFRKYLLEPIRIAILLLAWTLPVTHAHGADMGKTLHVLILNGEAGIDPATASEANTQSFVENIFDPLIRYQYLARPLKLEANTLLAMPSVSEQGKTYLFQIKPGIYFTPDPAFKGKKRELTAEDYVYSFKRLYDPEIKSPWEFLIAGSILGDEVLRAPNKFDYASKVAGLQAINRYTLRIRLKQANANFIYILTMPSMSVVAREVIEAYPGDTGGHPVGTGPYLVKEWKRSNRLLLEANPEFRETIFHADPDPGPDPDDQAIAKALDGKRLPLIGKIDIKVIEEQQTQILGFLNKEFDYIEDAPRSLADMLVVNGKLHPALKERGVRLDLFPKMETDFLFMNMDDPLIGGYTPEKIALRRAIALSYDRAEDIALHNKHLALPAYSPVPPNVNGYDPGFRSNLEYDIKLARALLDRFGYQDRDGDGYRETPEGKPLALLMHSRATTSGRQHDERWRKSLDSIGIRAAFKGDKYTDIIKSARLGKVQMFEFGWVADYPDGANFYQLLYGKNIGSSNDARFKLPLFDNLYEQSIKLGDSPERNRLYRDMNQLIAAYVPWVMRIHPLALDVRHPWVKNYKRSPAENTVWRYVDIDLAEKKAAR